MSALNPATGNLLTAPTPPDAPENRTRPEELADCVAASPDAPQNRSHAEELVDVVAVENSTDSAEKFTDSTDKSANLPTSPDAFGFTQHAEELADTEKFTDNADKLANLTTSPDAFGFAQRTEELADTDKFTDNADKLANLTTSPDARRFVHQTEELASVVAVENSTAAATPAPATTDSGDRLGALFVLAGGLLWGLSGACAEYIFAASSLSAHALVPWRLFVAGLLTLALAVASSLTTHAGRAPASPAPAAAATATAAKSADKSATATYRTSTPAAKSARKSPFAIFAAPRDLARLCAFSAGGIALCQYTYFWGVELANAAVATIIQYASPALVIAAVCAAERRAPRAAECAALLAIFAGVALLASGGDFSRLAIAPFALAVCAASAVGAALYALLPGPLNERYGALAVLGWAMTLSGAVLLTVRGWAPLGPLAAPVWAAIAAVVLLGTVGAFWLFMLGLARVGAARAGLLASIEPLAAAAIAWAWLGSSLSAVQLVGFALVILGIIISFRS